MVCEKVGMICLDRGDLVILAAVQYRAPKESPLWAAEGDETQQSANP